MNFQNFLKPESNFEYGFGIHYFLDAFNETFYKSSKACFDGFLNEYKDVSKWLIFSDYALYDKTKKRDVITFSIVPYGLEFDEFTSLIDSLSPRDLKKTRKVNEQFIDFLEHGPIFNISICLDRKRRLHSDEKYYFQQKFEMMIKQLLVWCETTPEGKDNYLKVIEKIKVLLDVVSKQGGNFKVIRDIEILSTFAAYFAFEVTKHVDVEKIGWFSDRDTMLSFKAAKFKTPIIFDFVDHLYYLFCESENIASEKKLILGIPESREDGKVWYDSLNRIPDLIAGTLSDYDMHKNHCSHDKFVPVIERLFVKENRNLFFDVKFSPKKGYSVGRITWANQ